MLFILWSRACVLGLVNVALSAVFCGNYGHMLAAWSSSGRQSPDGIIVTPPHAQCSCVEILMVSLKFQEGVVPEGCGDKTVVTIRS